MQFATEAVNEQDFVREARRSSSVSARRGYLLIFRWDRSRWGGWPRPRGEEQGIKGNLCKGSLLGPSPPLNIPFLSLSLSPPLKNCISSSSLGEAREVPSTRVRNLLSARDFPYKSVPTRSDVVQASTCSLF